MKSTRSCCSVPSSDVAELILTGLPAPVSRRPGSASPARLVARSVSVAADGKAKRNAPEDAGSRAMNNLRRSNSTTQVNQRVNSSHSSEQTGDFLAFFEGDPIGRKKLAALSKTSPEKKTTWNILDDQPRVFPGPSGSHGLEPPTGMRRKEATVLLAANFTANNRSNKGAMGNCVTTMVHNNYSTAEKGPAPKSSNQATLSAPAGASAVLCCTWGCADPPGCPHRFIQQVNMAAVTIQRWYRRHSQRHRTAAAALGRLMAAKREERQQRMEEGNILDLQERKEEERRKIREEKARLARHAAIQVGPWPGLCDTICWHHPARQRGLCISRDVAWGRSRASLGRWRQASTSSPKPSPWCSFTTVHSQQEPSSNSLTADNLEKFGKLNHPPGVPEDGALLSEAKLQSIISFLDEMEKSEQERPRSAQVSAVTQQRELTDRHIKQTEKELSQQLRLQREQYEAAIQRHLAFIDQLLDDKKVLSEKCEAVVAELKQVDHKYGQKINQMQEQHELEIKKLKELMSATEKVRREKWIEEKTKKIKEITVKGLEPEIQKLLAKHREDIRQLKLLHEAELLQSDERAALHYGREKEEQSQRERERARQRCEQQLEQEEQALELQRRRLYAEVAEEKERLSQQAARQRAEAEELRRQLEANSSALTRALRDEYAKEKEEQERQHQAELKVLKDQLELEKQAWEANYVKKEEAWLLSRERELREEMRKERDKEIELVIQRLEADTSLAKEECERAAESRIKRIRDKYEVELQELEHSERKLQERCNELKGRLAELEGESTRLQGLLKHKEQELEEMRKVSQEQSQAVWEQLSPGHRGLTEGMWQEFASRLVGMEEENARLKAEMAELRKDHELEEVHRRVKAAVLRKEESMSSLRKQYEAAVQRASLLESLLQRQRELAAE
uniref:Uncharacterized protein n=1 Tax=Geospiza parvula TaxID=87175 RepID=A0A8C3MHU0_GEOPR